MIKRSKDVLLGILIGVFLAAGVIVAGTADGANEWSRLLPFTQQHLMMMRQARSYLENNHVEEEKPLTEEALYHGAMKGMVSAVGDPYTRYVEPEQLREENMEMEGEYGGLGMYIGQRDGKLLVISPIEETPAAEAGVKPMDEIVKVDEKVVLGMNQNEVVKLLRGAPDTSVEVWMRRKDEDELLQFKMTRKIINIKTVRFEMIDDIGYVRLNNFHHKTAIELAEAIVQAKEKKAVGLILDMRNNPGGLLNIAVDVASQFLDGGLVVSMRGRQAQFDDSLSAYSGRATDLPLVVLINEGSASASEIVAGAVQDRKRGPLVGTKSYGKGSVQNLFTLPDNAGMYVTIARYTTPSGRIIDQKGLLPDYVVEGGPMADKAEDKQLQKAIGVMKNVLLAPK